MTVWHVGINVHGAIGGYSKTSSVIISKFIANPKNTSPDHEMG